MKALLLYANRYDFIDEKTNKRIQGASLVYVDPFSLLTGTDQRGVAPVKVPTSAEVYNSLPSALPAVVDLSIVIRPSGNGMTKVHVTGVKLVKDFPVDKLS